MNNSNWQSKQIVKTWFNRAKVGDESYNYFDRFISLWVSFNCFFVAEFYNDAKESNNGREPQERNYLEKIYTNEDYRKIYCDLVQSNDDFKNHLESFKELVGGPNYITSFRGKIADMRPSHLLVRYAQEFSDINNFEQFIMSVYKIRCNLFHGNKSPDCDGDVQLVETIFKAFLVFLEKIYLREGYLDE